MTITSLSDADDKIARLESEIAQLKVLVNPAPRKDRKHRFGRRPLAIAGISVLALGTLAGVAGASNSTTNVSFVALSPTKTLLNATTIATHKSSTPVVIGGTSTVPSNATTVELYVSAKGATAGGTLNFYPTGNPNGGSGQSLSYPKGATSGMEIQENVGQNGEVTIYNAGAGSAAVTAKILAYSTQVTTGDISGRDGQTGQVLTVNGTGAIWKAIPKPTAGGIDGTGGTAGQVLTNDGTGGAAWSTQGQGFANEGAAQTVMGTATTVAAVTVPAGTYYATGTYNVQATGTAFEECAIRTPSGQAGPQTVTDVNQNYPASSFYLGSGSTHVMLQTTGGTISMVCHTGQNGSGAYLTAPYLAVVQLSSATGNVAQ